MRPRKLKKPSPPPGARRLTACLLLLCALCGCSLPSLGLDEEAPPTATPGPSAAVSEPPQSYADKRFTLSCVTSQGFNPLVTTSAPNLLFAPLVYETLFVLDERLNPSPLLVTDYSSEDGILWYFTVDSNARFHDGSALTAADAAYSVQRAMYSTRYSARLSTVAGVTAVDGARFAVRLREANRMLPALLDIPVIKYDSIDSPTPPGTGPYKISEDMRRLELFAEHRSAAELPLDTIYLREYVSAEDTISSFGSAGLDLVINDPNGVSDLGYGSANDVRYFNTCSMHYLGVNSASRFFTLPQRRAFITFAVDRERIVTDIMGGAGVAASLPMSPVSELYSTTLAASLAFSPDKLVACLTSADILDHDDDGKLEYLETGIPMEIDLRFIVNNESTVKVAAARQIAEELRSYGMTVTLRELGWSDYKTALDKGNFDLYYGEVLLTADFDLTPLIGEDGALNYGGWNEASLDTLMDGYLAAEDSERRLALEFLQQYLGNTAPIVPICFEKREALTHRGVVSGMIPTASNVFYNIKDWTINPGD